MRLFEFREPAEDLTLYTVTGSDETTDNSDTISKSWFTIPLGDANLSHLLADNILGLIIRPKERAAQNVGNATRAEFAKEVDLIAPNYLYDSSGALPGDLGERQKAQLPPIVQVTLVAISEQSASRLTKAELQSLGNSVNGFFSTDSAGMEENLTFGSGGSGTSLEKLLTDHVPPVDYRIFTGNVSVSGSKWSESPITP